MEDFGLSIEDIISRIVKYSTRWERSVENTLHEVRKVAKGDTAMCAILDVTDTDCSIIHCEDCLYDNINIEHFIKFLRTELTKENSGDG